MWYPVCDTVGASASLRGDRARVENALRERKSSDRPQDHVSQSSLKSQRNGTASMLGSKTADQAAILLRSPHARHASRHILYVRRAAPRRDFGLRAFRNFDSAPHIRARAAHFLPLYALRLVHTVPTAESRRVLSALLHLLSSAGPTHQCAPSWCSRRSFCACSSFHARAASSLCCSRNGLGSSDAMSAKVWLTSRWCDSSA